ncbi:hypothetical protein BKK41_17520 [Bacillus cereus]|nr:hypothetical protein BKK41_17520 [Bacillus cereus]
MLFFQLLNIVGAGECSEIGNWKQDKISFTVIESQNSVLKKRTFPNMDVLFLLESMYFYKNNKESISMPPRMELIHSEEYLRKSIANNQSF